MIKVNLRVSFRVMVRFRTRVRVRITIIFRIRLRMRVNVNVLCIGFVWVGASVAFRVRFSVGSFSVRFIAVFRYIVIVIVRL